MVLIAHEHAVHFLCAIPVYRQPTEKVWSICAHFALCVCWYLLTKHFRVPCFFQFVRRIWRKSVRALMHHFSFIVFEFDDKESIVVEANHTLINEIPDTVLSFNTADSKKRQNGKCLSNKSDGFCLNKETCHKRGGTLGNLCKREQQNLHCCTCKWNVYKKCCQKLRIFVIQNRTLCEFLIWSHFQSSTLAEIPRWNVFRIFDHRPILHPNPKEV